MCLWNKEKSQIHDDLFLKARPILLIAEAHSASKMKLSK